MKLINQLGGSGWASLTGMKGCDNCRYMTFNQLSLYPSHTAEIGINWDVLAVQGAVPQWPTCSQGHFLCQMKYHSIHHDTSIAYT